MKDMYLTNVTVSACTVRHMTMCVSILYRHQNICEIPEGPWLVARHTSGSAQSTNQSKEFSRDGMGTRYAFHLQS
jgi:hypothetical protein